MSIKPLRATWLASLCLLGIGGCGDDPATHAANDAAAAAVAPQNTSRRVARIVGIFGLLKLRFVPHQSTFLV